MDRYMKAPITKDDAAGLLAGDYVYLTIPGCIDGPC